MDNNSSTANSQKRLSMAVRLLFCVGNFLMLSVYAIDIAASLGLPLLLLSAVFSCILLIDAGNNSILIAAVVAANIVPVIMSGIFSGSFVIALNILLPLTLALPLAISVRKNVGRFSAIAVSTVCSSALIIAIFALSVWEQFGALTVGNVKAAIDVLIAPVKTLFTEISTVQLEGQSVQLISDADIANMMYIIKATLIGSLAVLMMAAAYLTTLFTRLFMKAAGITHMLPYSTRAVLQAKITADGPKVELLRESVCWRIEVDSVSAWIYIISYILTAVFAASDSTLLFYVVAGNISTILTPVFLYCGIREIALSFKGRSYVRTGSKFVLIMCVVFIMINPTFIVTLLTLLGVTATLRENKVRRNANTIRKE